MTTSDPAMTGAKADAIEMLMTDHREVEQLFHQYEAATNDPGVAHHAAEKIIRKLSIHAAVEEQILYPMLRRVDPAQSGLVDHSLDEHQEVKELLAQADGRPAADSEVRQLFMKLKSSVEEHVEEEENKLFPALRNHCDQKELMTLGETTARAKSMADASASERAEHAAGQPARRSSGRRGRQGAGRSAGLTAR